MNKKQKIIDGKLVLEYQSGNTKSLALLVKYWHKAFCNKAFWLVKDADVAKDIAQDSWNVIINNINRLNEPDSFGSWALRIVSNKSLDWIKTNRTKRNKLEAYKYEQDIVEEAYCDDTFLREALLKAIKALPVNQQIVIRLFYVEGYALKDISKTLKISVGTSKSRLFHAREKLKLILKKRNYEN